VATASATTTAAVDILGLRGCCHAPASETANSKKAAGKQQQLSNDKLAHSASSATVVAAAM